MTKNFKKYSKRSEFTKGKFSPGFWEWFLKIANYLKNIYYQEKEFLLQKKLIGVVFGK